MSEKLVEYSCVSLVAESAIVQALPTHLVCAVTTLGVTAVEPRTLIYAGS